MKLIDKDALVAEIERRVTEGEKVVKEVPSSAIMGLIQAYKNTLSFLDTLEVKEVDLDKMLTEFMGRYAYENGGEYPSAIDIAKHFFELGLKANQENNVMGILEREVKIDAGGYPCIDCYIEFYDYEKDIPLAKEGDKVKVIVVKEE